MTKTEQLDQLLINSNGFLQTADAVKNGISRHTLIDYVQKQHLQKVAHGVYASEDAWPDEFYLLFTRNKRIIFSGESALYLHGLTDREPFYLSVSVPSGYNAAHLISQNVKVTHVKAEWYDMGKTEITTNLGYTVPVYDKERCICDMIRNKKNVEIQTFQTALNEYMKGKKNLGNLMRYATALRIDSTVRIYTEIML